MQNDVGNLGYPKFGSRLCVDGMKLPLKKKETGRMVTGFLLYSREKITLFSYRLSRQKSALFGVFSLLKLLIISENEPARQLQSSLRSALNIERPSLSAANPPHLWGSISIMVVKVG